MKKTIILVMVLISFVLAEQIIGTPSISFVPDTSPSLIYDSNVIVNISASNNDNISIVLDYDNSLVSWWRFDDGNGSVDYMGKNNGTLVNDTHQVDGGYFGKGLSFDGDNDRLSSSGIWHKVYNRTISLWAKPNCMGDNLHQMPIATGGNYYLSFYDVCDTNKFIYSISNASNNQKTISWSNTIIPNEWHLYTATISVEGLTVNRSLFIDGVMSNTYTFYEGHGNNFGSIFYIGALNTNYDYNGTLDDVIFWNTTLDSTQIYALYANTSSKYLRKNFTMTYGNHTYKAYAQNSLAMMNATDLNYTYVDVLSRINITRTYPSDNIYVKYGDVINRSFEVCCLYDDCGEINISLDPPADHYPFQELYPSGYLGPNAWVYMMGYEFQVSETKYVVELCKYSTTDKWVYLYDAGYSIVASKYITGGAGWNCEQLGDPIELTPNVDYFVIQNVASTEGYYKNGLSFPDYSSAGVEIQSGCYQSGTSFTSCNRITSTIYGLPDIGIVDSIGKEGLVSTIIGTEPFWTNITNPYNFTLLQDECINTTFYVNITGTNNLVYEFFAYANITSNMAVSNYTDKLNVTIIIPPELNIVSPTEGQLILYNTSIDIKYTIKEGGMTMDDCWYSINGNTNISTSCNNVTTDFPHGNINLRVCGKDSLFGLENCSSVSFTTDTSRLTVERVYPTDHILVHQYDWFNYTVNVSCFYADCGEVNVSLDPPAQNYIIQNFIGAHTGGPFTWSYIMGYRFTPNYDMWVTELCKYTGLTNYVKLYESATYTKIAEVEVAGGVGWKCAELASPVQISTGTDYTVVVPLEGRTNNGYLYSPTAYPRTINNVYIYYTVYQATAAAEYTNQQYTNLGTQYGMADIGVRDSIGEKFGLISTDNTNEYFWTNESNPRNITLNAGESEEVVFWVNATAPHDSSHRFYTYANKTEHMGISNRTSIKNVTIDNCLKPISPLTYWDCSANCIINWEYELTNDLMINGTGTHYQNANLYKNGNKIIKDGNCLFVFPDGVEIGD